MSTQSNKLFTRRAAGCLLILIAVPLLYYAAQAAARTAPLSSVQIIAHRGGARYAPENTLAAFRAAIAQHADALEFDVQMSKDGELVVIHDETVDRTTDGTGAVADLTLEQLRRFDAGNGEKIPTFDEVLQLAKAADIRILPETKSAHLYPGIEEKLVAALAAAGYIDRTVVQSFEADSLTKLHDLNPDLGLCALYGTGQLDVSAPRGEARFVCPEAEMVLLNPGMIWQAHRQGRQVFVWFGALEKPWAARLLRFFGADGFIVNDPIGMRSAFTN